MLHKWLFFQNIFLAFLAQVLRVFSCGLLRARQVGTSPITQLSLDI